MDKKIKYILNELQKLYPDPKVTLDYVNDYTFLIAVLLSAQSTDKRVNQTTPQLFALADTPYKMVRLNVEQIIDIVRPVGLAPSKGGNIYKLSEILINKHTGEVPRSFEELEALPGVGHKTASVVMSQAFGVATFPVDTHIHRMLQRWGISSGKSVERSEADAKAVFPDKCWNKLHLQIIYYAREYSPARGMDLDRDFITRRIIEGV